VRCGYYWEEEGRGCDSWGDVGQAEDAVSEEGVEDSELCLLDWIGRWDERRRTCHVNGTFLRLIRTKSAATIRE
jgi:hypothetical protein